MIDLARTSRSFWRIESINDSRHYEPSTGKPIAGTGDSIPCECCGRAIQVHVTVEQVAYAPGVPQPKRVTVAIIGTECARQAKLTFYGSSPGNAKLWSRRRERIASETPYPSFNQWAKR